MPYANAAKQKAAKRDWYLRHKEEAYAGSRARALLNRQWLLDQKRKPCADCAGAFPPVCMDYHHRDASTKVMNVGRILITRGRQTVLDEIAKCDLVCSNCHRIRTFGTCDTDT